MSGDGSSDKQPKSGVERDSEGQELFRTKHTEQLKALAGNPNLSEDAALALLASRDLPPGILEELARNGNAMKRRKVRIAMVCHPQTPRYVSLPIVRQLYVFELSRIAMLPTTESDLKITVEDALIARLETITIGERLALARQGTARIAGALLNDPDPRVMSAALANPRMTETSIIKSVTSAKVTASLVQAVCTHPKWSLRRELQMALLRNENTPFARAIQFAQELPIASVKEVLRVSRLPENVRIYLTQLVDRRDQ